MKKRIANSLVEKVTIDRNCKLTVKIRLNLLDIPEMNSGSDLEINSKTRPNAVHFEKVGTYIRTQSPRARRRRCAFCA